MLRLIIDSSVGENDISTFDAIATATGLYKIANVFIDVRNQKLKLFPLNTPFNVILNEDTYNISIQASGILNNFIHKQQVTKIFVNKITEKYQDCFVMQNTPINLFDFFDKNKTFTLDNITNNDIIILKEFLGIPVDSKLYIYDGFLDEIRINAEGKIIINNKECGKDYLTEIIDYLNYRKLNKDIFINTISKLSAKNTFDDIICSTVMYDDMFFAWNDVLSIEDIITYKMNLFEWFKTISYSDINNYCGFNSNTPNLAQLFYDINILYPKDFLLRLQRKEE